MLILVGQAQTLSKVREQNRDALLIPVGKFPLHLCKLG